MKKLLSVLASLAMLTTMSPVYSECTISDNTDLKSLAASLGADTDYLNILNYEHGPDYPDLQNVYLKFLSNCNQLEATRYPQSFYYTAVMSGSDMGISLLEILAHNGVISPSDIQNGAQSLSEITLNNETDKVITAYQVTQFHTEFSNYMEYLIASQTYEQQIDSLISTAESCMENNRYFLVTIKGQDMNHSVCGIGISEGEWEWNGKKYDKCILTLDSNDTDKDEKADGFREESCIYINSETKESYIPAYNLDMTDEPAFTVIDDDSLLNFKGAINPSAEIKKAKTDTTHFTFRETEFTSAYRVRNGIETPIVRPVYNGTKPAASVTDFDYIHVDMNREFERFMTFWYYNSDRRIYIELEDTTPEFYPDLSGDVNINDNMVNIVNKGPYPINSIVEIYMNDGTYNFPPFFKWVLWGDVDKDLSIEIVEEGMLLKSDDKIEISLSAERPIINQYGELQYGKSGNLLTDYATAGDSAIDNDILVTIDDEQKVSFFLDENNDGNYDSGLGKVDLTSSDSYHISSKNNVLVTINDEYRIVCYIDDNNDGVYDTPVQKGDTNYDGKIDAADASTILSHYAKLSTTSDYVPTDIFAMDFDGSGSVDASDASLILKQYSEVQTGK